MFVSETNKVDRFFQLSNKVFEQIGFCVAFFYTSQNWMLQLLRNQNFHRYYYLLRSESSILMEGTKTYSDDSSLE